MHHRIGDGTVWFLFSTLRGTGKFHWEHCLSSFYPDRCAAVQAFHDEESIHSWFSLRLFLLSDFSVGTAPTTLWSDLSLPNSTDALLDFSGIPQCPRLLTHQAWWLWWVVRELYNLVQDSSFVGKVNILHYALSFTWNLSQDLVIVQYQGWVKKFLMKGT